MRWLKFTVLIVSLMLISHSSAIAGDQIQNKTGFLMEYRLGLNLFSPGSSFHWKYYGKTGDDKFVSAWNPGVGFLVGYQGRSYAVGLEASYLFGNVAILYDESDWIPVETVENIGFTMASVGPAFTYYFLPGKVRPFLMVAVDYHFAELSRKAYSWTWVRVTHDPYEVSKTEVYLAGPLTYDMVGAALGTGVMVHVHDAVALGGTVRFDYISTTTEEKQRTLGSHGDTLKSRLLYMPFNLYFTTAFVF